MAKSPLYTRTGDNGTTSLTDGSRIPKNSLRLEAYGTVDELNSFIGAIPPAHPPLDAEDLALIAEIQNRLFDIGAYLATDPQANPDLAFRLLPKSLNTLTRRTEQAIDRLHSLLPPLKSFIIPAGTQSAAATHIARTVARRAERRLLDIDPTPAPKVVAFINRLSDYLFILARRQNQKAGLADTPWQKE